MPLGNERTEVCPATAAVHSRTVRGSADMLSWHPEGGQLHYLENRLDWGLSTLGKPLTDTGVWSWGWKGTAVRRKAPVPCLWAV